VVAEVMAAVAAAAGTEAADVGDKRKEL